MKKQILNTLSNILNKKLGQNVPLKQRTKWTQEFTGLTVRNWLMIPIRALVMLPLLVLTKSTAYIAEITDRGFDLADHYLR